MDFVGILIYFFSLYWRVHLQIEVTQKPLFPYCSQRLLISSTICVHMYSSQVIFFVLRKLLCETCRADIMQELSTRVCFSVELARHNRTVRQRLGNYARVCDASVQPNHTPEIQDDVRCHFVIGFDKCITSCGRGVTHC